MSAIAASARLRAARIGQSRRRSQHADADRGLADAADAAAGRGDVHHAVSADHDRAALSAAGAWARRRRRRIRC